MIIAIGAVGAVLLIAAMFARSSAPQAGAAVFGWLLIVLFWIEALRVVTR